MKHERKKEWFDDESFWIDLYPFLFSSERFNDAAEQVKNILKLTKPKGRNVLDLCCGPARYSIPLARAGYRVTGVDKSRYLLNKAKENAKAAKVRIEWIENDMRDFVRKNRYDLVLSLFTSFGYFEKKDQDFHVLGNIFNSLKSGGVFLIDVIGKEYLAAVFQPTTSEVLADDSILVQRHEVIDDWTRLRHQWIVIRKGKATSFCFDMTVYSGQELRDLMQQSGFVRIKLYGNLDGIGYGPEAQRLIAVGYKPE